MSRWLVGSSSTSTAVCWARARAISTLCFSPPDRVENPCSRREASPVRARTPPYQRPVLPAVGLQQPLAGLPPHHDHLLHREIEGGLLLLYHDGKPLGHLPVAHGQQIVPHEGQLPRLGAEHLVDVFEERGFAAAVGADEPDEFPLLHPEIHAPEDLRLRMPYRTCFASIMARPPYWNS